MGINARKIKDKIFGTGRDKAKADINIFRDWMLLLSIFASILLIVFVLGWYSLLRINSDTEDVAGTKSYVETINRSELQNMLDEYGAKEDAFEELSSERTYSVDPSL